MLVKFARAKILSVSPQGNTRTAAKSTLSSFEYENKGAGYLYCTVRACTADVPNLNDDMLPHDELKTAYKTFIGKPMYFEHKNYDLDRARGFVLDARYHDEDPEDLWIEVLMEMDEVSFPELCRLIRSGELDTVSMGCNIVFSECSVCGQQFYDDSNFCIHLKNKGQMFDGVRAYEICHGIEFFELSWVVNPADPTAYKQLLEEGYRMTANNRTASKVASLEYELDYDDDGDGYSEGGVTVKSNGREVFWVRDTSDSYNDSGSGRELAERLKQDLEGWFNHFLADGELAWSEGEYSSYKELFEEIADDIGGDYLDYEVVESPDAWLNLPRIAKKADNMVNKPKVPTEVDMDMEEVVCPICGNAAFDGEFCEVCEYTEYSEGFGDVDTETFQEQLEDHEEESEDEFETSEEDVDTKEEDELTQDEEDSQIAFKVSNVLEVIIQAKEAGYDAGIDYEVAGARDKLIPYSASFANWCEFNGIGE